MEYTDAPSTVTQPAAASDPASMGKLETAEGKASDAVAVLLSVIPGLGHIYKGHRFLGLLFILGAPFAVMLGALAATATAGFGLGLIPIYWFAVMFHVYGIEDRIGPSVDDEGEQY